jgi:mono/diheme cytochrome c family protein
MRRAGFPRTGLRGSRPLQSVAVLIACVVALTGCGRGSRLGSSHGGARVDSSFAAMTSAHGRSSLAVSRASGKLLYDHYCAICHGESGGGDGFNAYNVKAAFGVSPTAFADSATMAALRDSVALASIRDGGSAVGKSPAMPPWGYTLSLGELVDVWNYARSFASASGH